MPQSKFRVTGGPPLTEKPLPRFLAYVRASGGFSVSRGPQYSPTNNVTRFFPSPEMQIRWGPCVLEIERDNSSFSRLLIWNSEKVFPQKCSFETCYTFCSKDGSRIVSVGLWNFKFSGRKLVRYYSYIT